MPKKKMKLNMEGGGAFPYAIDSELATKSTAKLEEEIAGFENIPDPENTNEKSWGFIELPHTINGVPFEDHPGHKEQEPQNGNTRKSD
tara:strand:+ start:215 stop:478 length:264 start_codon:yes stop_codon:yes gene_type:complete